MWPKCNHKKHDNGSLSLNDVASGGKVVLKGFEGGCKMHGRLMSMGLAPGVSVEVISNIPGRPLVLSILGSRLMLCQKIAACANVKLIDGVTLKKKDRQSCCNNREKRCEESKAQCICNSVLE